MSSRAMSSTTCAAMHAGEVGLFVALPFLNKERIERFVVDRISREILSEDNLGNIVSSANQALAKRSQEEMAKLESLKREKSEVEGRLTKLYDALETGVYEGADLASRIKLLLEKKKATSRAEAETEAAISTPEGDSVTHAMLKDYCQSLKETLEQSAPMERKAFLRSFVKEIEVDAKEAKITYTLPRLPANAETGVGSVLPIVPSGSPTRIRT
jgi:site-specific DNA recombinase